MTSAWLKITGAVGGALKLDTVVVSLVPLMMTEPACVATEISPSSTVNLLSSPAGLISPATLVPRMPIVATGVLTCICVLSVLAIWPEVKTNTPFKIENAELPCCVVGW